MCRKSIYIWFLVGGVIASCQATYTSEETNENSKSVYSAVTSILGSTENSHNQRKATYDNPPAFSNSYSDGHNPSGVYHNGPVPATIGSEQNQLNGVYSTPSCTATGCSRQPKQPHTPSYGGGKTEDIDYPRPASDNRLVDGTGAFDVRSGYSSNPNNFANPQTPSSGAGYGSTIGKYPSISNTPNGPEFYPTQNVYGVQPGGGSGSPLGNYGSSNQGTGGYNRGYSNPNQGVGYGPPSYPATNNGYSSYLPPGHSADYHNQHPHHYGTHNHLYGYPHEPNQGYNQGHIHNSDCNHGHPDNHGYSTHDHSLKTSSEYKEVGHHVGPFQGGATSLGYNGAWNRGVY